MLRRTPSGRKVRPLDLNGPARTGLGRPFFRALGIPCGLHRKAAASNPHLHCPARRSSPHAPRTISSLHLSRFLAMVLRTGLARHEARRKLARAGQVFPPIRRSHRRRPDCRCHLVCLVTLAKPYQRKPFVVQHLLSLASATYGEPPGRVAMARSRRTIEAFLSLEDKPCSSS